jgi:hypothetical protein
MWIHHTVLEKMDEARQAQLHVLEISLLSEAHINRR